MAVAPAAVISHRLPGGALGGAHLLKLLRSGKAFIGMAAGQKLMGDFGMTGLAGELIDGLAVPIEVQPAHPVKNGGNGCIRRARAVGILDPQLEFAAMRSEEHTSELQSLMRNSYAV